MTHNVFGDGTLNLAQLRNEVSTCKYRTSQREKGGGNVSARMVSIFLQKLRKWPMCFGDDDNDDGDVDDGNVDDGCGIAASGRL